jgi:hypothetical protein
MKHYLSMGFGVNSVALYLLMQDMKMDFEAVFVNHGGDWPETYEYAEYFIRTGRPVTVLRPNVGTVEKVRFDNIIDWLDHRRLTPSRMSRFCTDRFKTNVVYKYVSAPCWMHIGFASDEDDRASINQQKGVENRYLLIENNIDRQGCVEIIKTHGLEVPRKSGCYVCPFQGLQEFKELRGTHPDLFCKAMKLEEQQNNRVKKDGRPWKKYYLCGAPLSRIDQIQFLPGFGNEYPPCQCRL